MLKNYGFCIVGFLIVLLNIIVSQNLPASYFQITKNNQEAYASFLRSIQKLPEFSAFFQMGKNIFGQEMNQYVFKEHYENEKNIRQMQTLLTINPYQKNTLYNLYLLYKQEGDVKLAQEYLSKAQAIDPMVR